MKQDQLSLLLLLGIGVVVFVLLTRTSTPQAAVQQPLLTRYVNEEVWEIQRDSRGYISNLTVHRDARSSS